MKPPYTARQGQFLAYISHYITLHGRPPAEAENREEMNGAASVALDLQKRERKHANCQE